MASEIQSSFPNVTPTFFYNQLSITPFQEGVQFTVDLVIDGKRTWSSTRRNSHPTIYPLLREAIGRSREEQEVLFTQFFLQEERARQSLKNHLNQEQKTDADTETDEPESLLE